MYEKDSKGEIHFFDEIDYDESFIPRENYTFFYNDNKLIAFGSEVEKNYIQRNNNVINIIHNDKIWYSFELEYLDENTLQITKIESNREKFYKKIIKNNNTYIINNSKYITKITFDNYITIDYGMDIYIFNSNGTFLESLYDKKTWDKIITKNKEYYLYHPNNKNFTKLELFFDTNHNLIYCGNISDDFIFTNYSILPCDDEGNILKTVDELKTDYFIEGLEYKEPEKEIVLEKPEIPTEEVSLEKNSKLQFNYIYIILLSILILTFIIIIVLIIRRRKNGRN